MVGAQVRAQFDPWFIYLPEGESNDVNRALGGNRRKKTNLRAGGGEVLSLRKEEEKRREVLDG